MSLEAGKLEHRVRFEREVAEVDSDGEQVQLPDGTLVTEWQTVHECWAEVAPVSAREFGQSNATQALLVARVTMRWTATAIDAACRMVFRSKIYNVEGVLPDKVSGLEYYTLPLSEGVSNSGL